MGHQTSVLTLPLNGVDGGPSVNPSRDQLDAKAESSEGAERAPEPGMTPSELKSRLDGMATWAGQVNSDLRGLNAGHSVLQNGLQDLAQRLDTVVECVSAIGQGGAQAPDPIIGYAPTPEQQAQLFAALAEWQLSAKHLEKGSTANIQTRGGSLVSYRYADIAAVSEIARSAGASGLSHFHCEINKGGQGYIRTYLTHKGGGWISCDIPLLIRENNMTSGLQQWASTCTMARRYGLFMVLGIAAGDEDDDGAQSAAPQRSTPSRARSSYNRTTSLTPDS